MGNYLEQLLRFLQQSDVDQLRQNSLRQLALVKMHTDRKSSCWGIVVVVLAGCTVCVRRLLRSQGRWPKLSYYRVTGNSYVTVIFSWNFYFGITLHSLYRKYFLVEIILLYITLSWPQPLSCRSFCLHYITLKTPEANSFCDTLHFGYIKNVLRI